MLQGNVLLWTFSKLIILATATKFIFGIIANIFFIFNDNTDINNADVPLLHVTEYFDFVILQILFSNSIHFL